jgi:hypothetical protein
LRVTVYDAVSTSRPNVDSGSSSVATKGFVPWCWKNMSLAGARAATEGSATTPLCIRRAKSRDLNCELAILAWDSLASFATYSLGGPGMPPTTPPTTPPFTPPATPPSTPNGKPATPPE